MVHLASATLFTIVRGTSRSDNRRTDYATPGKPPTAPDSHGWVVMQLEQIYFFATRPRPSRLWQLVDHVARAWGRWERRRLLGP
jgi:hypothetical protein